MMYRTFRIILKLRDSSVSESNNDSQDNSNWNAYVKDIYKDKKVEKIKTYHTETAQRSVQLQPRAERVIIMNSSKQYKNDINIPESDRMHHLLYRESLLSAQNNVSLGNQQLETKQYTDLECGKDTNFSRRLINNMRSGKWHIDAKFDLHGYTINEGYEVFCNAIISSFANCFSLILVVTGKGISCPLNHYRTTLKESLPKWVNTQRIRRYIRYFSYASPKHGENGAFYVVIART